MAGYEEAHESGSADVLAGDSWWIVVRDLLTGRLICRIATGPAPRGAHYVGSGEAIRTFVTGDGAVAWLARNLAMEGKTHDGYSDIWISDKLGTRPIAVGARIERESLVLVGTRLYWTQAGKSHSAVLH